MPKRSSVSPGRRPPADGGGSADTERRARGENITVAVRVRPLTSLEKSHNAFVTVEAIDEAHVLVNDPDDKMGGIDYLRLDKTKTKHYRLDSVFGPESTQAAVYAATARPLARKVVEGYNACCFAYGATGAGKTFTMTGTLDDPGVIPLTLDDLVLVAAEQKEEYDVKISMQYVEIYNEKLKDLLNPSDAVLDVREVPSKGTYVAGATDKEVATCAEMMELIHGPRAIRRNSAQFAAQFFRRASDALHPHPPGGNLFRTTEATNCNETSSRSHAVLQLTVHSKPRFSEAPAKLGKLSMIDLAGSERATKTDNRGERLTEGKNINKSLLALGNCINALADKTKKASHVPYRDSKLTRLLKTARRQLPDDDDRQRQPRLDQFDETLNSLKYANRAAHQAARRPPDRDQRAAGRAAPPARARGLQGRARQGGLAAGDGQRRGARRRRRRARRLRDAGRPRGADSRAGGAAHLEGERRRAAEIGCRQAVAAGPGAAGRGRRWRGRRAGHAAAAAAFEVRPALEVPPPMASPVPGNRLMGTMARQMLEGATDGHRASAIMHCTRCRCSSCWTKWSSRILAQSPRRPKGFPHAGLLEDLRWRRSTASRWWCRGVAVDAAHGGGEAEGRWPCARRAAAELPRRRRRWRRTLPSWAPTARG